MSALELLKGYGSDEDTEEEDFMGFAEEPESDRFPLKTFLLEKYGPDAIQQPVQNSDESTENAMECSSSEGEEVDSDGSFFATQNRKWNRTKKEIRKAKIAKNRRLAHKLISATCGCRKNCDQIVSKDERAIIHDQFWKLDQAGQTNFIRENVHRSSQPLRLRNRFTAKNPKKSCSYIFSFRLLNGTDVRVCRKLFLNTIGYGDNCGNIIYRSVASDFEGNPKPSKRGKYERSQQKHEAVKSHILTYNPSISHYRRAHAPNRYYLPSDLTGVSMHNNYQESTPPDLKVNYSFYSHVMSSMNISLVKLGNEQCEACVAATLHQSTAEHTDEENFTAVCSTCKSHVEHLRLASMSRSAYKDDGDKIRSKEVVFAVDLQKVIQLPRLEGIKSIVFTQRLLAYNETFAPVHNYSKAFPVIACVWDESTSGRSAGDITSCFDKVVDWCCSNGLEKVTFWLDNCSNQNKNWNLFLYLTLLLNAKETTVKQLTLKFFESGHTFMAADSFHAAVEKAMRNGEPVCTFPEFKRVVQKAKSNVVVEDMSVNDFFEMKMTVSQYTLTNCKPRPYIENIRKIIFEKGSYEMNYSSAVNDSEKMHSCCIMSKKQMKIVIHKDFNLANILTRRKDPAGITTDRKKALLNAILPVIKEEQKLFWNNLPEQ
ncbi:uncharacterized protein LOC129769139 [Toxorhynchites rutilus septentrionalis]|uniref:uncharacterized protein LOC129769139 n=1 Tax=Toxorhynchites rutilus septentrionalis TaxID=329112 RepID=UPI00247B1A0A|nr:uncharacterized protein LOC129769139 [Toxorhynchites rutilus septentrionalis]